MSINQSALEGEAFSGLARSAPEADLVNSGTHIKRWRERRHLSQKELASAAGVSCRHISFVETGRSKASRKMILRLCEVLDIPYRARNGVLEAGGFGSAFGETSLHDKEASGLSRVLDTMLGRHEPSPAIVLDGNWNVLRTNEAGRKLLAFLLGGDIGNLQGERNLVRWLIDEPELRKPISNWNEVAVELIRRLHKKIEMGGADRKIQTLLDDLIGTLGEMPCAMKGTKPSSLSSSLLVPISIRKSGMELNFFASSTNLTAPKDITCQEIRIEALHPASSETEEALKFLQISRL
jgi:transcriptional regulator with XRE-family HTH domain